MQPNINCINFFPVYQRNNSAKQLSDHERQKIALEALSQQESVTDLSRRYSVSRKFVYQQKDKASQALKEAFSQNKDSTPLFTIQVTPQWLEQVVLALLMSCHSSYAGVIEFFRDILSLNTCKGSIFNIVQKAFKKALEINKEQDLSAIQVGAHDEIFQGGKPVLVGCDVYSTYIYLLSLEEQRDADTWAIRLLELSDQGMHLDHTIADGGKGLRSGQKEAWPDVPCWGDVFHPLYDMGKLCSFLENRSLIASETVQGLEKKMEKAKKKNQGTKYSKRLGQARKEAAAASDLHRDIATLASWLQKDILSATGPGKDIQRELLQFVVEELKAREPKAAHRIRPIRSLLEKQGEELLLFTETLEQDLQGISQAFDLDFEQIRKVVVLRGMNPSSNHYWTFRAELYRKMGGIFYQVEQAVGELLENTVRASSIVENVNSRLRNYFFLRKTLGQDYLRLLQFFFNHRRFLRSRCSERIGKSPRELLTGEPHPHWLEMLGYTLFSRADQAVFSRTHKSAKTETVFRQDRLAA